MKKKKEKSGIAYLVSLADKNGRLLYIAGFFSILSGLCAFIPFVMVYQSILALFEHNISFSIALEYGTIAALAIVGKFLFMIIGLSCSHIGAFNVLYTVRIKLMEHISKINLGFFTNNTSGHVKKIVIEDVERIENFLAHQIPDVTVAIIVPIIVFLYMLTLSIPMALCILLPVILGGIIQIITMKINGPQMPIYHKLLGNMNSGIMQFINGMPEMKSFNMTMDSFREYANAVKEYDTFWHECTRKQGYPYTLFELLIQSGMLFSLPIGGYLFLQGDIPLATYIFFMIISIVFLTMLANLRNFAQSFMQISSGMDHIKSMMDLPILKTRNQGMSKDVKTNITFDHVSFGYDENIILKDITMEIPKGTLTAFVGASGAGKSTAAQLIPKFWEVDQGTIKIAGININDMSEEVLMNHISFVFQDAFMLSASIYENIAIGQKSCSLEQVQEAAKAAQIHDFIMQLPAEYDTLIGEDGVKLSGGEKQRVCIARAILKDAPIIIFDEATSYTDIENEYKIQLALNHLLIGKTTIMIAHRLHTIKNADQICVFDQGELKQTGTHQELTSIDGLYATMWQTYIGEGGEHHV